MLQGGFSREIVDTLQCLTAGSDWTDEQNFTQLHLVILDLYGKALEATINEYPYDIHTQDAMGRTPFVWAAARGADVSVATLLAHGADPNVMDTQYTTAVSYAAQQGHATCVRLLLEAGADPDPEIPGGAKVGSALNCASRSATDSSIIKNLLYFGADIETCGVDGKTRSFTLPVPTMSASRHYFLSTAWISMPPHRLDRHLSPLRSRSTVTRFCSSC